MADILHYSFSLAHLLTPIISSTYFDLTSHLNPKLSAITNLGIKMQRPNLTPDIIEDAIESIVDLLSDSSITTSTMAELLNINFDGLQHAKKLMIHGHV